MKEEHSDEIPSCDNCRFDCIVKNLWDKTPCLKHRFGEKIKNEITFSCDSQETGKFEAE